MTTGDTAARPCDDTNLVKSDVTFPSEGSEGKATQVHAFLATPTTEGKRAGVIVIHEIFGLTDHIKEVACRLAQAGYTALATDLFTREGKTPDPAGGFQAMREYVGKIPDSQLMTDLNAAIRYLKSRPDSNGKVGVVGFCWGGRVSMLLAASAPELDAAVAYYGRISGEPTPNQPAHPIDLAQQMNAPLLGNFGATDQGIPPAEAEKLRSALQAAHKPAEIHVYEGAGHAFNNDTRESYHPEAAHLAWQRTLTWFNRYLKT